MWYKRDNSWRRMFCEWCVGAYDDLWFRHDKKCRMNPAVYKDPKWRKKVTL